MASVSGRPEQPKERTPSMSSVATPYTEGDIKSSRSRQSGLLNNAPTRTGSFGRATSNSGQLNSANRVSVSSSRGFLILPLRRRQILDHLNKHGEPLKKSSRQNSGPLAPVLPTTGLITSGPITSGPLNSAGAPRKSSGPLESTGSMKLHYASVLNNQDGEYSFHNSFPKPMLWSIILLFVMGFIAGGFILGAVRNPILLAVVVILFVAVAIVFTWNTCWGRRVVTGYITNYPHAELRTAKYGQFVKVSGVVTCGNITLESSFQKVPRRVYTSTSLYEYRGWDSKASNPMHHRFTWALQSLKVTPYLDESVMVDINPPKNGDVSPEFLRWLGARNLSSDGCVMRLKEGVFEDVKVSFNSRFLVYTRALKNIYNRYIKEGSTGVVQWNENVCMIVPPAEPFSTGCVNVVNALFQPVLKALF